MKCRVMTLFPEMFSPLKESILKRAQQVDLLELELINFREFAENKHKNVDDIPYGGGAGMVLKPEPLFRAVRSLPEAKGRRRIILLSPQGKVFDQKTAWRLSEYKELVFLCGHYEGFDERIRCLADEEISLGDFVLTGGELAAMVIIDAVARLIPGVLGKTDSFLEDSHEDGLLEYPHYTRPPDFEGMPVPEVLLSGHHQKIQRWRRKQSLQRTFQRRLDLFVRAKFEPQDYPLLEEVAQEIPELKEYHELWSHLQPRQRRKKAK